MLHYDRIRTVLNHNGQAISFTFSLSKLGYMASSTSSQNGFFQFKKQQLLMRKEKQIDFSKRNLAICALVRFSHTSNECGGMFYDREKGYYCDLYKNKHLELWDYGIQDFTFLVFLQGVSVCSGPGEVVFYSSSTETIEKKEKEKIKRMDRLFDINDEEELSFK